MATLLHSEPRRLYSWWWDSHNSPKNSKWLQENLTDMDAKVKAMIKLIEEDADSFARRAEMYYKKRPELMKLVEEFYRAYRALAERYDHATVELRQAHRTMAEAFPNQIPYILGDDPSSGSSGPDGEPHTPEMPHPIRAFLDPDDLHKDSLGLSSANMHAINNKGVHSEESDTGIIKRGLKQLNGMFGSEEAAEQVSKVAEAKMKMGLKVHETTESDTAKQAEKEVQTSKKALVEIQAEKDAVLLQYQQSLQKLSSLERELRDAGGLVERASRAEIEINILKETLARLEAEREAGLLQYNKSLERISGLENIISRAQEEANELNERAITADIEAQSLKQELSRLEAEKESGLLQYNQCLELISILQNKISLAEENARMLNELNEKAETEVKALKQALTTLKEEKEAVELRYEQCLEKIVKMENEISHAQKDVKQLNSKILTGAATLKSVEEQRFLLERSNQSLQLEAENLAQKIAMKDQELSEKELELQKLQNLLQDERSHFIQVEATLQTFQKLHSRSHDEQRALALELQNRLQMLNDLEIFNQELQEVLRRVNEENQSLSESNNTSSVSIMNLKNDILSLKEMKEKLEEDFSLQVAQSNSLEQEIYHLKKEINCLNRRYEALMEQVQAVGLNPKDLSSSVKDLQNENMKLKEVCEKDRLEKEVLYGKLNNMNEILEKNAAMERSLSELNGKLEALRGQVNELKESCQFIQGEKSGLVVEKAILLSQLQIMTENMQKLLEKNALLENSLSGAKVELEGLRTRSTSLEEFCQMLKNEKSNLQKERSTLVSQLENVEQRLGNLERRFTRLEEKFTDLEKEKETTLCQVKELWGYLSVEKQERSCYIQSSESRLADLENQVHLLQEESTLSKKEFEEELDRAVNAQVEIFILQRFVEDLEEKNLSLLMEYQKQVEASKFSDKLRSELEIENLEQQVEVGFLLDEIKKLRMGIHQVFRALQFDPVNEHEDGTDEEQIPLAHILDNIEDLKSSLLRNEDERQQLVVENLVLLTLIGQLKLDGAELDSEKKIFEHEFKIMTEKYTVLQKDKHELLEMNRQLRLELSEGEQQKEVLKARLATQHVNLVSLQVIHLAFQEENFKVLGENRSLLWKFSDLKEKMHMLEEENSSILQEAVANGCLLSVFESFGTEKAEELKALSEDRSCLHAINGDLKKKVKMLEEKLEMKVAENLHLSERIEKLQQELHDGKDLTDQLNYQILIGKDFLRQKAIELLQVEQKLKVAHNLNADFCRTIEELQMECEESKATRENIEKQIQVLSDISINQKKEIECLQEEKEYLESELDVLRREVEEQRTREENLSLELLERSNEFELWEAEASSFYFDLQISSIHEVLLQNKVHELSTVCVNLEDENAVKDVEIERMKEKLGFLESEIGGLKAHFSEYVPAIASLKENVESLERNALSKTKCFATDDQGLMVGKIAIQPHEKSHQELLDGERTLSTDGISDLLKMQIRVKAFEQAVIEEIETLAAEKAEVEQIHRREILERENAKEKLEASIKRFRRLALRVKSAGENDLQMEEMELENQPSGKAKLRKSKTEISEARNGVSMKDIPLDQISNSSLHRSSKRESVRADDQMLELWESAEHDCSLVPLADTQKQAAALSENVAQFKDAKQKRWVPSNELRVEKEVGIDKLEVSTSIIKEPNQRGNRGKILERLASDAQKLTSLQTTVLDLKKKMETKKRSKKTNDVEFERVKRQLQEVEGAVKQLVDTNDRLTKDMEEGPSSLEGTVGELREADTVSRKGVIDQVRKGSEKIGRLQFEVQSIQYILPKLEDEKKSKGKLRFSGGRTGILLRDFIYIGRRNSRRQKKSRFCGCMRPSTSEA